MDLTHHGLREEFAAHFADPIGNAKPIKDAG
jgi:hypothetical protein